MPESEVDKEELYGSYDWPSRLYRKICHKAVDIPDEDMNIRTGIGWKELAVIAAMVLGAGGVAAYFQQLPAVPTVPAASSPVDSEYEVRFFDADGKPISLEPWKPK